VRANVVVGLLDHIYAEGATHIGFVVDSRFRRLSIGTSLVRALLQQRPEPGPVAAECGVHNRAAAALLRGCSFQRVAVERYETIWRHV
jgi:RimJ/RimL family protein N-acetyltransferase